MNRKSEGWASRRACRTRHAGHARTRRPFLGELLEERAMLTVYPTQPFHNSGNPFDVNSDGNVSNSDLFSLLSDIRRTGPRDLLTGLALGAGGEGEGPLLVDVNGDNLLTNLDLFYMVRELRGEGQVDITEFTLSFLTTANAPLPNNTVNLNEPFQLLVQVDDLRTATPVNVFGMAAAYLDVVYAPQVQASGNLNFAPLQPTDPSYSQNAADHSGAINNAASELDEVGNFTIASNGVGASPVTLVRATFNAISAPPLIAAAAVVDTQNVQQNSAGNVINVLGNDDLVGLVQFTSEQATDVGHEVITTDPATEVPVEDIIYGGATLRVRTGVTIQVTLPPTHGQAVVVGNAIQYTPDNGYAGADSFTYTLTGAGTGQSTAAVNLMVVANNNPPTARDDIIAIDTGSTLNSLNVLANDDTLPDVAEVLTIISFTQPNQNGTVAFGPGNATLVYTPVSGFEGTETFSYTIDDGNGGQDTATVTLVVAVPVPLVEISVEVHDAADQAVPVVGINEQFFFVVYVDDLRTGSPPPASLLGVASAYLDLLYDQNFMQFVPAANFFGVDITWGPGYDADPVIIGNPASGLAEMVLPVQPGIFDEIGTALEGFSSGGTGDPLDPPGGLRTELFRIRMLATGTVDDTPVNVNAPEDALNEITLAEPPLLVDLDQVTFTSTTFSIRNLSATAPVAVDDFGATAPFGYTTQEDTTLVVGVAGTRDGFSAPLAPLDSFGVLNNDTDGDAIPGTQLQAILVTTTTNGLLTLNADGTFTYEPNDDFNGPDSFVYRVSDGGRLSANTATVTINVASVLDAPVAQGDTYGVNTDGVLNVAAPGVLANDSNIEPGSLVPMLVTGPASGVLTGGSINADGSFTYTPTPGFIGMDSFTYKVLNTTTMLESNVVVVNITVGALPGSMTGQVWADVDGDGEVDRTLGGLALERGIGGVEIRLTGTDAFNMAVNRTTRTDQNGNYAFTNVVPGVYTITQIHPAFIIDETPNSYAVTLGSDEDLTGFNFAEAGLQSNYITQRDYLCSSGTGGIWAGINTAGTQEWFVLDTGWENIRSVTAALSPDRIFALLTVTDLNGQMFSTSVATVGTHQFRFLGGNEQTGYVVRFDGDFADFQMQPVGGGAGGEGEGDSYANAVDYLFGQEE